MALRRGLVRGQEAGQRGLEAERRDALVRDISRQSEIGGASLVERTCQKDFKINGQPRTNLDDAARKHAVNLSRRRLSVEEIRLCDSKLLRRFLIRIVARTASAPSPRTRQVTD